MSSGGDSFFKNPFWIGVIGSVILLFVVVVVGISFRYIYNATRKIDPSTGKTKTKVVTSRQWLNVTLLVIVGIPIGLLLGAMIFMIIKYGEFSTKFGAIKAFAKDKYNRINTKIDQFQEKRREAKELREAQRIGTFLDAARQQERNAQIAATIAGVTAMATVPAIAATTETSTEGMTIQQIINDPSIRSEMRSLSPNIQNKIIKNLSDQRCRGVYITIEALFRRIENIKNQQDYSKMQAELDKMVTQDDLDKMVTQDDLDKMVTQGDLDALGDDWDETGPVVVAQDDLGEDETGLVVVAQDDLDALGDDWDETKPITVPSATAVRFADIRNRQNTNAAMKKALAAARLTRLKKQSNTLKRLTRLKRDDSSR